LSRAAVPDRFAQFGVGLAGGVETFGVETVKGEHPYAEGAAGFGEALAPGADLQVGGDDDARGGAQFSSGVADAVEEVGGFAGGGGGEEEMELDVFRMSGHQIRALWAGFSLARDREGQCDGPLDTCFYCSLVQGQEALERSELRRSPREEDSSKGKRQCSFANSRSGS
jgi:hypothetical protein